MKKHITIPVFIPMQACPFQCIFCDQHKISGHWDVPTTGDVALLIEKYLEGLPRDVKTHGFGDVKTHGRASQHSPGRASQHSPGRASQHSEGRASLHSQVGFFGGTFTGLPLSVQEKYLSVVRPFIDEGKIQSIRLSTRPDFIDDEKLLFLKKFHVTTIELGAQSMDDEVLKKSGRGHRASDTETAASKILKSGFRLGLQMMIGLPGDTLEKLLETAKTIVRLGAADVRIYPVVVIKDTVMETLFRKGKYSPLSLEEAVNWTKQILPIFEAAGVNVIRIGLHPSEGLLSGKDIVAGPFHVSFKELVLTELWADLLDKIHQKQNHSQVIISIPDGQINYAVGYQAKNKRTLEKKFSQVKFIEDSTLKNREFHVDFC